MSKPVLVITIVKGKVICDADTKPLRKLSQVSKDFILRSVSEFLKEDLCQR